VFSGPCLLPTSSAFSAQNLAVWEIYLCSQIFRSSLQFAVMGNYLALGPLWEGHEFIWR